MTKSAFILVLSVTFALNNTARSQTDCARSVHLAGDISCTGLDTSGNPIAVNVKTLADKSLELSVELNSVLVFKRGIKMETSTDRTTFLTDEFKNGKWRTFSALVTDLRQRQSSRG